jgi:hypothetical protein
VYTVTLTGIDLGLVQLDPLVDPTATLSAEPSAA